MDWEALRKLRASRVYDEQSFKLHQPLSRPKVAHRAEKPVKKIVAPATSDNPIVTNVTFTPVLPISD